MAPWQDASPAALRNAQSFNSVISHRGSARIGCRREPEEDSGARRHPEKVKEDFKPFRPSQRSRDPGTESGPENGRKRALRPDFADLGIFRADPGNSVNEVRA